MTPLLTRGDPVPDSNYVRDFCCACDEAIRVAPSRIGKRNRCDRCRRSELQLERLERAIPR